MAKDNFNNDELVTYYSKIYEELDKDTTADPYGNYVLGRVKGGQKTVLNKSQTEIRNFDMSFLDTIESVYPAMLKIMRNPKKSLRYESEVVAVEKARKVNADTVRHLSSHTHLIKEIKKNGDVIPSKVLTTYTEEELAIYENRFIKSLVRRCEIFLERRYEVMKISLESFETEKLEVKNEFKMSGQEVTVEVNVAIKNDLTTNVETTKEQFDRLCRIREMIQGLKGTEFMRALAKARDVLPPIMKTNIILHNPDFKLCYGLWLYLDRVDSIATNIDVKEKSYKFSSAFDKDINAVMALALTSFIKNRQIDDIYSSKKLNSQKAPKPVVDNTPELELNLEADNKKLEDYTMNELLLSQTAKFFEASMEGIQKTGVTMNESIRVVYRQMLDMLDQIYPMAFGVADDELDSKDLYEQLEYARRQLMVFKIVHQQKQMNIARMGKESKRIERLIGKLEEKIKKEEARERERLERERLKAEAERQAEIERKAALEAKKRKFEQDAIAKAKEVAIKRDEEKEQKTKSQREELARIYAAHNKKREHLKKLQEEDNKAWNDLTPAEIAAQAPTEVPHRRKDEYDDLSDEELAALMAENEMLLDQIPEKDAELVEEEKAIEAVEKKANPEAASKKKAPAKKEAPKKKSIEDIDMDNLSDDDLDALMAQLNGDGDFDLSDIADEPEEPKQKAIGKKKAAPKKEEPSPEPVEEPKQEETPVEETPQTEEPVEETAPEAPTEEATPEEVTEPETPTEEAPVEEAPVEEPQTEEPVEEESPETESSDNQNTDDDSDGEPEAPVIEEAPKKKSNDEFEDLSDEDLEKLMAENGLFDEPEAEPEAPSIKLKGSNGAKPKKKATPKKEEGLSDYEDAPSVDDDISDEDLDALMKENNMF
ncbi:MAG: DUF2357 domain-containing protein [Acholeplasmatales bacterium]|nr:DUF2357 domain-containing protein [Acholeplasmatales bacterium]